MKSQRVIIIIIDKIYILTRAIDHVDVGKNIKKWAGAKIVIAYLG